MGGPARREYELTRWGAPGPVEPIPLLLYHRADVPGPKPAAVYHHGVTQTAESYVDSHPLARRLADAGFLVALPDAPGHGLRPSSEGLVERLRASLAREFTADVGQAADEAPALLDWLAARPEVEPSRMALVGTSMGGFTAAAAAARVRERLRTAVCIAGCADLPACFAATDSIGPEGWGPLDRAVDVETMARIASVDALGHAHRIAPLPVLLLHGERDTWNPCATSLRFGAALESSCVRIVPGAVHWPPAPAIVDAAVEWLRDHV